MQVPTAPPRLVPSCARCGRPQPPLPRGVNTCVYCSAPLPVSRWTAHPPPGTRIGRRRTLPARPYAGPPSYRGGHPRWGLPRVAWRPGRVDPQSRPVTVTGSALSVAAGLAALTAVAASAATAGESWRYVLMVRGRTQVLEAPVLTAADVLVQAASWAAAVLALITAAVVVPVVVRLHGQAARLAGRAPARPSAAVVARLVIPGWNLYGAGQVLAEVDGTLACRYEIAAGSGRSRPGRLVLAWAVSWLVNGVLVLIMLGRAFGSSLQAIADTVELHVVVDLVAAVVAGLTCALLLRWRGLVGGRDRRGLRGWTVAAPAPTSTRGAPAHRPAQPVQEEPAQQEPAQAVQEAGTEEGQRETVTEPASPAGAETNQPTEAASSSADESAASTTITPQR